MTLSSTTDHIAGHAEFLDRDQNAHPLRHAPDINTLDRECVDLVEETAMDHPASRIQITESMHEREVQPLG